MLTITQEDVCQDRHAAAFQRPTLTWQVEGGPDNRPGALPPQATPVVPREEAPVNEVKKLDSDYPQ